MLKSNYRPISVVSAIPKVFEQLKFDQLYRHFSPPSSDNMSGFLFGHSCCTALFKQGRACKHLYKYLSPSTTPPTSRKTVSHVKMTNFN